MGRPADTKVPLTKAIIEKAAPKPGSQKSFLWDTQVSGFGVSVTETRKTYIVDYYTKLGKRRRLKVGNCDSMQLPRARDEARKILAEVASGNDPADDQKRARDEEKARVKFGAILDAYIAKELPAKRPGTVYNWTKHIEIHIRPVLGDVPADALAPDHIDKLRNAVIVHARKRIRPENQTLTTGQVNANRIMAFLRTILRWAGKRGYVPATLDPLAAWSPAPEHARHRYLSADELERLARELDAPHPLARTSADAVRLMLLTGARKGEVLAAEFDHFDLDKALWTKPASHTKQNRLHRVPLSPDAVALIRQRRQQHAGKYVFPARSKADAHLTTIHDYWASVCKRAGIEACHIHDLRHTYASLLASSGQSLPIIGALLGHSQAATTQRYAHLYDDPLRRATESIPPLLGRGGPQEGSD